MKNLEGKVAVVTGAASGIGTAMAARFGAERMKLVLADIEEDRLHEVASSLRAQGADVAALRTDVSRAEDVDALASEALRRFGGVHVLCNNAGVGAPPGPVWERSTADWEWVLGVNLWGVIHGLRTFVPLMIEQNAGHIVNTASVAGLYASPLLGIYDASKHAVVSVSESLHYELIMKHTPVKVSILLPGPLPTRIFTSERNRPSHLMEPISTAAILPDLLHSERPHLATNVNCDHVAELVLQAIRDERLYVITHPDMKPYIRARMEAVLADRNPGSESREQRLQRMRTT